MQSIKVNIRVVTKSPKLQTTQVKSAEAEFLADKIIGVITLPDVQPGEPECQLVTPIGPFDVYEKAEVVLKKVIQAVDKNPVK